MRVTFTVVCTNVNHHPEIRGIHYSVGSTAIMQIGIKHQEIYQLLAMDAPKKKCKVRWSFNNGQYIFETKDIESGIICQLVGILLILILRLTRSHTLTATLPPPFTTGLSRQTNPWACDIRAVWCNCHPSSLVKWQPLSRGISTPPLPLARLFKPCDLTK